MTSHPPNPDRAELRRQFIVRANRAVVQQFVCDHAERLGDASLAEIVEMVQVWESEPKREEESGILKE